MVLGPRFKNFVFCNDIHGRNLIFLKFSRNTAEMLTMPNEFTFRPNMLLYHVEQCLNYLGKYNTSLKTYLQRLN